MERKRRTRAKPKPVVRKSERTTVQEPEAPKILVAATRQVEKDVKEFKPEIEQSNSFTDVQKHVYTCFIDLDTMVRLSSLETIELPTWVKM